MLKKILGEAPFDVSFDRNIVIVPGRKTTAELVFSNDTEYDLPLSIKITFGTLIEVSKTEFDILVPAEGKTETDLTFSKSIDAGIFTGNGIGEIEIVDRIFDSKTLYEFNVICESAYKCSGACDDFSPTDEMFFSRKGRFYANKGECVCVQIPLAEETEYKLHVISGKIKNRSDGEIIKLRKGINSFCFEMTDDGSFEFQSPENDETVYPDTLNTKYFIKE